MSHDSIYQFEWYWWVMYIWDIEQENSKSSVPGSSVIEQREKVVEKCEEEQYFIGESLH